MYDYWRPKLTRLLIEDVRKAGGILVNLASLDILGALRMDQINEEVRVITPEFQEFQKREMGNRPYVCQDGPGNDDRVYHTGPDRRSGGFKVLQLERICFRYGSVRRAALYFYPKKVLNSGTKRWVL